MLESQRLLLRIIIANHGDIFLWLHRFSARAVLSPRQPSLWISKVPAALSYFLGVAQYQTTSQNKSSISRTSPHSLPPILSYYVCVLYIFESSCEDLEAQRLNSQVRKPRHTERKGYNRPDSDKGCERWGWFRARESRGLLWHQAASPGLLISTTYWLVTLLNLSEPRFSHL